MRERLGRRLAELQAERAAGEQVLARLRAERADLEQTLLRISGAIQVLEELLVPDDASPEVAADPPLSSGPATLADRPA